MKNNYLLLIILLFNFLTPTVLALTESDVQDKNYFDEGVMITNYPNNISVGDNFTINFDIKLNTSAIRRFELPIYGKIFDCEKISCKGEYSFIMSQNPITIITSLELTDSKGEKPMFYDEKADFLWTEVSSENTLVYLKRFTILPEEPQIEVVESTPYLDDEIIDKVNQITERSISKEQYDFEKNNGKLLDVVKNVKFKKINTEKGEKVISVWTIKISPGKKIKKAKNVYIYEEVPKEGANTVNDIIGANKKFVVLRNDPLIMWHFEEVDGPVEISYETGKASITGAATVVTAESVEKGNIWQIIIPILLIPIIGFLLIYFNKFTKKEKKKK